MYDYAGQSHSYLYIYALNQPYGLTRYKACSCLHYAFWLQRQKKMQSPIFGCPKVRNELSSPVTSNLWQYRMQLAQKMETNSKLTTIRYFDTWEYTHGMCYMTACHQWKYFRSIFYRSLKLQASCIRLVNGTWSDSPLLAAIIWPIRHIILGPHMDGPLVAQAVSRKAA